MKRTLIGLATLALALSFAAHTNAQTTNAPAAPAGHRSGDLLPPPIVNMLALTPDQQSKYNALKAQYQQEREAWFKDHQDELDKIRHEIHLAQSTNDVSRMSELRQQQHEAIKPVYDLRKSYVDKVRDFLTDEQKDKLDKAFPQWKGGPGHPTPAG